MNAHRISIWEYIDVLIELKGSVIGDFTCLDVTKSYQIHSCSLKFVQNNREDLCYTVKANIFTLVNAEYKFVQQSLA